MNENTQKCTNLRKKLRVLFLLAFALPTADALASKNNEGWKSRPSIPELEQKSVKAMDKVPWDALRFLKQSSKFITLPSPFQSTSARTVSPGEKIWEANNQKGCLFDWSPLDDVVMGGASSSSFDATTGIWGGTVTSANNGGFVGIRTTPFSEPLNLEECTGIELRVKGGNKGKRRFKAVTRDSTDFNGVCWTSSFDIGGGLFSTAGGGSKGVNTVRLPFQKQIPTIFARTVPDQTFRIDNVVGLQLAYSMFEYDSELNPNFSLGDFSLQIIDVRVY